MELDLSTLEWTMVGWQPNAWAWLSRQAGGLDTADARRHQCTPEIPTVVPGAVQEDLLRAGLLPDWNVGLNAPLCEWVEHRHWEYRCSVHIPQKWAGQRILLCAEGLDYAGAVLVDGQVVGRFWGMMQPHEFDLTAAVTPGRTHRLAIFFEGAPHEQGQIGYTSRSRYFKARFAYGWDWCVRLVPLGIWDRLTLRAVGETRLRRCLPLARYEADRKQGSLSLRLAVETPAPTTLYGRVRLWDGDTLLYEQRAPQAFAPGESETLVRLPEPLEVDPWWPNGLGTQKLYSLTFELEDAAGRVLDGWRGRVGFKQVRWLPCAGAPANTEPWICEVNGERVFLQGVNWTPVRMTYGSVTREMYAQRLQLYAEMGMNILRVWGGAFLEKRDFYELCDELGLMVWQEFPLSSSGCENVPPHEPQVLAELAAIAASYIWRRGGHACHLVWSGGNELTREDARLTPVDESDPAVATMAGVVARLDLGKRFVATSPSGPSFSYDPAQAGKGLHHDTHGPWVLTGSLEEWKAYWDHHDAMLISEVGVPACASLETIERYAGELDPWPPSVENPLWQLRQPWWIQWERYAKAHRFAPNREELGRFVFVSQEEQAEALAYMVASCKRRFPRCSGVMLWMGHDCYPCFSNTSIIDYDGNPKPAVEALRRVLRGDEGAGGEEATLR